MITNATITRKDVSGKDDVTCVQDVRQHLQTRLRHRRFLRFTLLFLPGDVELVLFEIQIHVCHVEGTTLSGVHIQQIRQTRMRSAEVPVDELLYVAPRRRADLQCQIPSVVPDRGGFHPVDHFAACRVGPTVRHSKGRPLRDIHVSEAVESLYVTRRDVPGDPHQCEIALLHVFLPGLHAENGIPFRHLPVPNEHACSPIRRLSQQLIQVLPTIQSRTRLEGELWLWTQDVVSVWG